MNLAKPRVYRYKPQLNNFIIIIIIILSTGESWSTLQLYIFVPGDEEEVEVKD